ncbi:hypothetical protein DPMN_034550 [Dreissena polymorpha]|uniref:Uncharacterized protein n=1 Tax=Dreissena polymorpha TaxID=45954 RepID=A0A9D4RJV6_DREPO|nr:hypothetical protein DPMN_034550 [Dreissena polymorpha]
MKVFLDVEDCGLTDADQLNGRVRRFFLSTEPEVWDYAPSGLNAFDGRPLDTPNTYNTTLFYNLNMTVNYKRTNDVAVAVFTR